MAVTPRNIPPMHWQADLPEEERYSREEEPYDPPDHDDYYLEKDSK